MWGCGNSTSGGRMCGRIKSYTTKATKWILLWTCSPSLVSEVKIEVLDSLFFFFHVAAIISWPIRHVLSAHGEFQITDVDNTPSVLSFTGVFGAHVVSFPPSDPYAWGDTFPSCHPLLEEHHSPINLDHQVIRNNLLGSLHLEGFDVTQTGYWTLKNDGHSGEYSAHTVPSWTSVLSSLLCLSVGVYMFTCLLLVVLQFGSGMSVSGGGLPDVYHTIQLHFHWGGLANNGSEHTVDRRRYPMEVQYGQ